LKSGSRAILLGGFVCLSACGRTDPFPLVHAPVILICVDTLRADHLPAYGYREVATPHLDALRADSVLFRNAYAHVPLTLASHATLFTGLLPPRNGIRDNLGFVLRPDVSTLASTLRDAHYATGGAVSAEVLSRGSGIDRGFEFWDDAVVEGNRFEREGSRTANALLRWLDEKRDRPVFAFLHLFEPHAPYDPPEPYKSRYKLRYDGEIARADEIVGAFLDRLKAHGLYERALIVFLSDHGEGLGEHGEPEHGVFLYREDIHVPLFVKLPGSRRARETVEAPVALTDVFPTLVRLVGVSPPPGLDGRDLFDSRNEIRRIYSETLYPRIRLGWSDLASLIDAHDHYIEAPRPEFFDVVVDPGERRDLAASLPPAFRSMRLELARMPRPFELPRQASAERAHKLASLGYLTGVSPDAERGGLPDPKDQIGLLNAYHHLPELIERKNDSELIPACREFLKRVPAALDMWRVLADALERQGRRAEAIAALEAGLRASSVSTPTLLRNMSVDRLVVLLARAGRDQEVLKIAATGIESSDPEVWNAIGVGEGKVGHLGEARNAFAKVLSLDSENALAHFNLGMALMQAEDVKSARDHFEHSVRSDPKYASAWSALGRTRAIDGDEAGAMECWKRAVELDGSQFDALYNLAIVEGKRGDVQAARRALERFLASAPPALYARDLAEARRLLKSLRGT
jgi:choline-sulfatase